MVAIEGRAVAGPSRLIVDEFEQIARLAIKILADRRECSEADALYVP